VHNFARECQSHWRKNLQPHLRYVATIPRESVRHKSNTFRTALCTCLCRLRLRKPVSMKQTKQQKVRGSKFMFKMSTIHANTCIQTTTPLRNRCRDDGVVQQPPLSQQTFFQLLHIMDPRTVDPLLKDTPDAVVHRIQIWQIGWPYLWRNKLWRLSLQHGDSVTCAVNGMISVTSTLRHQVRDVHGTQSSKFTNMISIHLQSCVPKIIKNLCIFVKVIVKKSVGTFFM